MSMPACGCPATRRIAAMAVSIPSGSSNWRMRSSKACSAVPLRWRERFGAVLRAHPGYELLPLLGSTQPPTRATQAPAVTAAIKGIRPRTFGNVLRFGLQHLPGRGVRKAIGHAKTPKGSCLARIWTSPVKHESDAPRSISHATCARHVVRHRNVSRSIVGIVARGAPDCGKTLSVAAVSEQVKAHNRDLNCVRRLAGSSSLPRCFRHVSVAFGLRQA